MNKVEISMIDLIIIGGSTGFLEVKGIIDDINEKNNTYRIIGILDDNIDIQEKIIQDVKVIGRTKEAKLYHDVKFVFAIGSLGTQKIRDKILQSTGLNADQFETLIHPTAIINKSSKIGHGCIIHPRIVLGNDITIGNFVVIAVGSTVGPYVVVEDYAMITSHVLVLTGARIGYSSFIGSMTCVIEGAEVGSYARVGVASVVSKNIPAEILAIGNPVRFLGKY